MSALQTLSPSPPKSIFIPVIEVSSASNEEWWRSFQVRAKNFFAEQLGCCSSVFELNAPKFGHIAWGTPTPLNSLEGIVHLMCSAHPNLRCFAIINEISPQLDAIEIVILEDERELQRVRDKITTPSPLRVHSPGRFLTDDHHCLRMADRTGICWHNFCGPRFLVEWGLHFNQYPRHTKNRWCPSNRNEVWSPSVPPSDKIIYDSDNIARRLEDEESVDAHHTTDHSTYQEETKCPCAQHRH